MAMAMAFGRRINVAVIDRLVGDALATINEFGSPGNDVEQLLAGMFADPDERTRLQTVALQRTVRYLMARSPFYRDRFAALDTRPKSVTVDTLSDFPVTTKQDVVQRRDEFVCSGTRPYLATRTTGTTGPPAEVWLSHYEVELWSGLTVLSMLLHGEFGPADRLQVNISSRATAVVHENLRMCSLTGASIRVLGLIPPDETLAALLAAGPDDTAAPTVVHTYPSYLAELVLAAERSRLGPADFRLRHIVTSGEILSPALARAACAVFGVARVESRYGMTTILPVTGRDCSRGHLHFDLNTGFCEVLSIAEQAPCAPGQLGTLVVTPYYPYRECMPMFRYDTRDLVRSIADDTVDCELAGTPAFSPILGKADHLLSTGAGPVTTRDLVEVLEALPSKPWPARFRASVVRGVVHLTVPVTALSGLTTAEVEDSFRQRNIDLRVQTAQLDLGEAKALRRLRSDLLENTFTRTAV